MNRHERAFNEKYSRTSSTALARRLAELKAEEAKALAASACPGCGCTAKLRCPVGNDRMAATCFIPPWAADGRCTVCSGDAPKLTQEVWDAFCQDFYEEVRA